MRRHPSLDLALGGSKLGAVVKPHPRGTVHRIEDAEVPIITGGLLVMEVVAVRLLKVPRQPKPRAMYLASGQR